MTNKTLPCFLAMLLASGLTLRHLTDDLCDFDKQISDMRARITEQLILQRLQWSDLEI